jgi:ribosomal protein S18 acetylase RimI-like enzyme
VKLVRLGPSTIHRLKAIELTLDPAPYVAEIEAFMFGRGAATHLHEPHSALILADDSDNIVGAALHCQDESLPGCQYIAAILVDCRVRGRGFGRLLLDAVIADARQRSGHEYVRWLVHPDNAAMLKVSRSIATTSELGIHEATGHIEFIDP